MVHFRGGISLAKSTHNFSGKFPRPVGTQIIGVWKKIASMPTMISPAHVKHTSTCVNCTELHFLFDQLGVYPSNHRFEFNQLCGHAILCERNLCGSIRRTNWN